jgi:hypothetical protein
MFAANLATIVIAAAAAAANNPLYCQLPLAEAPTCCCAL